MYLAYLRKFLSILFLLSSIVIVVASGLGALSRTSIYRGAYDRQARSFLEGRLDICDAPRELLELQNPYNPSERGDLTPFHYEYWDHSLYNGKIYFYFGVGPTILLYTPYRWLTGGGLDDGVAMVILWIATLLGAAALSLHLQPKFNRELPWISGISLIVLVASSLWLLLLAGPSTYVIPIAGGLAGLTWGVYFLATANCENDWISWRLALASFFFGFGVASRPTCTVSVWTLIFIVSAIAFAQKERRWRTYIALIAPCMAIHLALAWYNYARFQNPFEFGNHFQIAIADQSNLSLFVPSRILSGLYIHLLHPLSSIPEFPYFGTYAPLPEWAKADRMWIEKPFGYLYIAPWLLVALGCGFSMALAGGPFSRRRKRAVYAVSILMILGVGNLLMSALWMAVMSRYSADYASYFAAAGLTTILEYAHTVNARQRMIVHGFLLLAAIYGCYAVKVLAA